MGAEEEQCAVQLVFTESSYGVTGKMGQSTKGGFESERLYITSSIKAEAKVPSITGKLVGGLKRAFRVKTSVFLSAKILQTMKERKKVVEKDAWGDVCL